MFRADYHLHTAYSSDSEAPIDKVVEAAVDKGLNEIAITDHLDFDPRYTFIDYDKYIVRIDELREKYAGKIDIIFGIEVGLESRWAEDINRFTARYPFEFIIGSSHTVQTLDVFFDRKQYFGNKTKTEAYTIYFEEMLKNIKSCKDFKVYGHLDYITRYGMYEDNSLSYFDYSDLIDEVLRELIDRGKGIEINTSGFRYGIENTYPQIDIIKRYKELGGEIVTTGSDSHKVSGVADHIDFAYEQLERAGFKYVTSFKNGKPKFVKFN